MNIFQNLHQPTDRFITVDQQEFLFCGGTAYLGLLANPEYIDLYKRGIDIYGLNNGTSRSNNVQLGVYAEAEEVLANRFGFESAALFSSGYLAAQATVLSLSAGKEVFYAPGSHPSLWQVGCENPISNFTTWARSLVVEINASGSVDFVIIANSLDNLSPELYDFSIFSDISDDKRVLFILDDSHGIGVLKKGQVSVDLSFFNNKNNFDLVVLASLAKGMGTDAGLVLGASNNIASVKSHPIFMGASPSSPAALYALLNGVEIYEREFEKLKSNIAFFSLILSKSAGFSAASDFPVFTSSHDKLYKYLAENQVLISSFPYPLADSPLLNRVVVSSLHKNEDLDRLAYLCNNVSF